MSITKRAKEIDNFGCLYTDVSFYNPRFLRVLVRNKFIFRVATGYQLHCDRCEGFDSNVLLSSDVSYLTGFFQSYKYFDNIRGKLHQELLDGVKLDNVNADLIRNIQDTNSVSVHVRRSDYITQQAAARTYTELGAKYYETAMSIVLSKNSNTHFYVFSDDIKWCKNNLKFDGGHVTYMDHNCGNNSWKDMVLMSFCRSQIVANSSFSWWGAWLSDGRHSDSDRCVVAPRQWFRDSAKNTLDRYPGHWNIID